MVVTISYAAQLMNLAEANYAWLSAAIVFGFFCDKRGKSQPGTDFLKNEKLLSYLLITNFYILNIYVSFIYLFSFQYNIQRSYSMKH